jgi:hypothetical protein
MGLRKHSFVLLLAIIASWLMPGKRRFVCSHDQSTAFRLGVGSHTYCWCAFVPLRHSGGAEHRQLRPHHGRTQLPEPLP